MPRTDRLSADEVWYNNYIKYPVNVKYDKIDDLNATIVVDIAKEDYEQKVNDEVKKLQKKVVLKGFRQGKAPMAMVNKMYGKSILADELNSMASKKLNEYITENKLDILGYPMSSDTLESKIDLESNEEFSFAFDLGLAPSFELKIDKKDKLPLYKLEVTKTEIDKDIAHAREQSGDMEVVDVSEGEDIIYAFATELNEDGNALEGGVEKATISFVANMIEDKKLQKKFLGLKAGDTLNANIKKVFNDNETVISNTLAMPKEGVNDLNDSFTIEVTEVKRRTLAELNEDFYKNMFGAEDFPKNEEEYRDRVKANLERYYANEAQTWLDHEIGDYIIEKHGLNLPDNFLKRWLQASNEKEYNAENIDERYAKEREALVRRLIVEKVAEKEEIKANAEDIKEEASIYFVSMYRQYGMNASIQDAFIAETVEKKLKEREFVEQMGDRVVYRKVYDAIKQIITLKEKKTSIEKYYKMVNEHKH
ncbi:MAG: trigger factor [Bacteroidia bacterium]|jgi:trigger factor|nr:trigger factor [Bacteroidia bacterium]